MMSNTTVLALDQAITKSGWAIRLNDVITYGLLKQTPESKRGAMSAETYMVESVRELIRAHPPDYIALEGVHLGDNVSTLIALATFRGRLIQLCYSLMIPVIDVSSPEIMRYLHLPVGTTRLRKKERASFFATAAVFGEVYASDGTSQLIQQDSADAIIILLIAEARLHLETLVKESEG